MPPGSAFSALGAVGITFAAWASLLVVGVAAALGGLPIMIALALGQSCLIIVPALAIKLSRGTPRWIGLARPDARQVVAALLVGTTMWYPNLLFVSLLDLPEQQLVGLQQLIDRPPLVVVLLAVALLPAVCEELVFRGVLLRGLASRYYAPVAVIASALVFSLYHLNIVQLLPTFLLGLAVGAIALRAGSVVPAMLAHFLNNTMAIVIARGEVPWLAGWLDRHPVLGLVGATASTTTGLAIAMTGARRAR